MSKPRVFYMLFSRFDFMPFRLPAYLYNASPVYYTYSESYSAILDIASFYNMVPTDFYVQRIVL